MNTIPKQLVDGDMIVTGPDVRVVCTLRCRRGKKMERSALHLSILIHAAVYRCTSSIAFLRLVPSYCEWLHGGHPSRPLHEQHRVASGREEETRWSRHETWCTDHESMISCNLEDPTKPPRHCRKSITLANGVRPKRIPSQGNHPDEYSSARAGRAAIAANGGARAFTRCWRRPRTPPLGTMWAQLCVSGAP